MVKNRHKYAVSICREPVGPMYPVMLRGDFATCFRQAAACGYDGVELQMHTPSHYSAEEILTLCEQYHLGVAAISTGMEYGVNGLSLIAEDEAVQQQATTRLLEYIPLAQQLHCKIILGCMRGQIEDFSKYEQYEERLIANITPVLDEAERQGVEIVMEAINLYVNNYLNSFAECARFIDRVGRNRLGLHIDTHHMSMYEKDFGEAIRNYGKYIRYVHYSDSNRWYPGGGNVDFYKCTAALHDIDYGGWITMECIPLEDGLASAKKGLEYCLALETAWQALCVNAS